MSDKKALGYKFNYIIIRIIILFQIIKIISNECNRDNPFKLKDNTCISQCSEKQLKSGDCILDNTIIKTQWLTNIIMLNQYLLKYFNYIIYPNGDIIFETSSFPCNSLRVFYGLKKNGR